MMEDAEPRAITTSPAVVRNMGGMDDESIIMCNPEALGLELGLLLCTYQMSLKSFQLKPEVDREEFKASMVRNISRLLERGRSPADPPTEAGAERAVVTEEAERMFNRAFNAPGAKNVLPRCERCASCPRCARCPSCASCSQCAELWQHCPHCDLPAPAEGGGLQRLLLKVWLQLPLLLCQTWPGAAAPRDRRLPLCRVQDRLPAPETKRAERNYQVQLVRSGGFKWCYGARPGAPAWFPFPLSPSLSSLHSTCILLHTPAGSPGHHVTPLCKPVHQSTSQRGARGAVRRGKAQSRSLIQRRQLR